MATAFALSIFSTLLSHSYQCIAQIVVSAVNAKYKLSESKDAAASQVGPSEAEIVDSLEHGKSIISILLEHGISAVESRPAETKVEETKSSKQQGASGTAQVSPAVESPTKQKKHKIVDRRRRTRRRGGDRERLGSDEDESGSDSDLDGSIGGSSSGSLSVLSDDLGEDDLELLDGLSDSSSPEPDDERDEKPPLEETAGEALSGATTTTTTALAATGEKSPVKRGKRQIILAANFSMPPSPPHRPKPTSTSGTTSEVKGRTGHPSPLLPSPLTQELPSSRTDSQLEDLLKSTQVQTSVYTACSLVAEESSLMALRVFVYWLQSYPIIIATCTQVSLWELGIHL